MSTLNLYKNSNGVISKAAIGDNKVEGFVGLAQNLTNNSLRTSLTVDFSNIAVSSVEATALTVTVAAGTASGTTKATITESAGTGLSFISQVASAPIENVPTTGDKQTGTSYTSGSDIVAVAGQQLRIYEVDSEGFVYRYYFETLSDSDIAE